MNEAIAQLAEQAAQESALLKSDMSLEVTTNDKSFMIPDTFIEKFSELIINKCIDTANDTRYDGKVVAARIKFIFGVEE